MVEVTFAKPQGYAQPGKRVRRTRKVSPDPSLRHCLECDEFLPLEDFGIVVKTGRVDSWCRPCRNSRTQVWVAAPGNAEALRARRTAKRRADRERVLAHYGGSCACCGEAQHEFLAIDHVEGGGHEHRKTVGAGATFVSWLLRQGLPEGYRVLCHNCNSALGFYGFCPHGIDLMVKLHA